MGRLAKIDEVQRAASPRVYCFGECELDVDAARLRYRGEVVAVAPVTLRLLEAFVQNPDRTISEDELVATAWDGRVLVRGAWTVAIARLRKLLDDVGVGREALGTVRGRGYRFLTPVQAQPSSPLRFPVRTEQAPLVGREPIMQAMRAALQRAAAGAGSAVWLAGVGGMGKTRLVEELADDAARRGMVVAWGRCRPLESPPALWPWVGLLRALSQQVERDAFDEAGLRPWGRIFAELIAKAQAVPHAPVQASARRRPVLAAIARVIALLATRRPLLLVFDDLDRADDPSLELLACLLPRLARTSALIVATLHPASARRGALARLVAGQNAAPLVVGPLEPSHVHDYLTVALGGLDRDLVRSVYQACGGNPFYLVELTRQLAEPTRHDRLALEVLPVALELSRRELSRLDDATRLVLTCGAVAGPEFSAALTQRVLGLDSPALRRCVDAALALGVLAQSPASCDLLVFGHAFFRTALLDGLGSAERRAWDRQVAWALTRPPAGTEAEAEHERERCVTPRALAATCEL